MSLIDTLQKPLKPSVVQFLRAQQCGFHDGYPMICCGVLPKTLNIFNKRQQKTQRQQKKSTRGQTHEYVVNLNRAPPAPITTESVRGIGGINKLSIYQPEAGNIMNPPHFDITVSTAAPGASTVPYLSNLKRDARRKTNLGDFLNTGEAFKEAMSAYMDHYDLQRTRRSGALKIDAELDVEVR